MALINRTHIWTIIIFKWVKRLLGEKVNDRSSLAHRLMAWLKTITLCTKLGFFHPFVLGLSHCIFSQPLNPMGIHIFHYPHVEEKMASHDVVWDVFTTLWKMWDFMFHKNKPMCFCPLPYSLCAIELTLCYQSMVSTH